MLIMYFQTNISKIMHLGLGDVLGSINFQYPKVSWIISLEIIINCFLRTDKVEMHSKLKNTFSIIL